MSSRVMWKNDTSKSPYPTAHSHVLFKPPMAPVCPQPNRGPADYCQHTSRGCNISMKPIRESLKIVKKWKITSAATLHPFHAAWRANRRGIKPKLSCHAEASTERVQAATDYIQPIQHGRVKKWHIIHPAPVRPDRGPTTTAPPRLCCIQARR